MGGWAGDTEAECPVATLHWHFENMPAIYPGCLSSPFWASFRDCQEEQGPVQGRAEGGCVPRVGPRPGGLAAGAHGGCDEGVCGQPWPGCPVGLTLEGLRFVEGLR